MLEERTEADRCDVEQAGELRLVGRRALRHRAGVPCPHGRGGGDEQLHMTTSARAAACLGFLRVSAMINLARRHQVNVK